MIFIGPKSDNDSCHWLTHVVEILFFLPLLVKMLNSKLVDVDDVTDVDV